MEKSGGTRTQAIYQRKCAMSDMGAKCRKQLLGPMVPSESYPFSLSLLRLDRHCWTSKAIAPAAATTGVCEYCPPWCLSTQRKSTWVFTTLISRFKCRGKKAFKIYHVLWAFWEWHMSTYSDNHINYIYYTVLWFLCFALLTRRPSSQQLHLHHTQPRHRRFPFIATWATAVFNRSWVEQASQNNLYKFRVVPSN